MRRFSIGLVLAVAIAACIASLSYFEMLPTFEELRESRHEFSAYVDMHPVLSIIVFSLIYIVAVALSVPLATPLSILSGFLFGTVVGTLVVVFSATVGATAIFLLARYFFRDFFEEKFKARIDALKVESMVNGFRDILILRLIPAVPFALINVAAGFTRVRLREYVLATFLGIMPFSFVYVHAGMRLSEVSSLKDIASSETVMFLSRIAVVLVVLYLIKMYFPKRSPRA